MKIELIKNEANRTVGWSIIGETKEDKLRLGTMRNLLFFGTGDDVIEYDGVSTDPENENLAEKLHFATKGYIKKKKEEFRKKVEEGK